MCFALSLSRGARRAVETSQKQEFEKTSGKGKPCYGEMPVCWAEEESEARRTAHKYWPTVAIKGELAQILPA